MRILAKLDATKPEMTPRKTTVIAKNFRSDPGVLESFYVWLEATLESFFVAKEDSSRMVLATGEAFSNALLHGNRANPRKKVQVQISRSGDGLAARVGDEGEGSQPRSPRKSELFDTSGRGWELMHKLADRVSVRRQNGVFWVELRFKMPKDKQGEKKRGRRRARKIRSGGR